MSSTKKAIIGFFTFLPIISFIWYLFSFFSFFFGMEDMMRNSPPNGPDEMFGIMGGLFIPAIIMVLSTFGMMIYYLIDIFSLNPKFKNDTGNNKLIWTLVILFAQVIGMIVYFFVEIRPRKELPPLPYGEDKILDA